MRVPLHPIQWQILGVGDVLILYIGDVTLGRLKQVHLVANEVLLLAQVSCRDHPPLKDPIVSSRVVCPDLQSVVDCDSSVHHQPAVLDERQCSHYGRLIKPVNQ